ncbi:MAG: cytochrome c oxidase subunit 3 [Phycisphaeraceae bacterium]
MTEASHHGHGEEGHHPHLAHHFHTPKQQFESAKLGIWLFLATEILMFGGLFCAYSIYRGNHKEVYLYAHKFLDTNLGAINTAVLLTSSLTMAWGVRAAMLGQKQLLSIMLALTFLGGCGFMGIKTIEYSTKWNSELWPGTANAYYPVDTEGLSSEEVAQKEVERLNLISNYLDRKYLGKYRTGPVGPGSSYEFGPDYKYKNDPYFYDPHKGHGEDGHDKEHVADGSEHADPEHNGEVAHAATEHAEGHDTGHGEHASAASHDDANYVPIAGEDVHHAQGPPAEVSMIPPPAEATSAVVAAYADPGDHHHTDHGGHAPVITFVDLPPAEQGRVHIFYQIYYMMTGLHGLHVLVGMGLLFWVWVRATFYDAFGPNNFTTIEVVGLYWHIVDLIWIFLFPLLYLIH